MWVICMFDLPTKTKKHKRAYTSYRKYLLRDGFTMMQYSVYIRHCTSLENAQVHIGRMSLLVPEEGEVRFLTITDYQYGRIKTFLGKKSVVKDEPEPTQLQLF